MKKQLEKSSNWVKKNDAREKMVIAMTITSKL